MPVVFRGSTAYRKNYEIEPGTPHPVCCFQCTRAACSDPDTATINLSTLVLSALAYYAWKRGLDECEPAEAPETMYN